MRISCPSCQTVYDVPDALLAGAPRAMRCARCAREWTVEPPAPPSAPPPAPMPPVAAPPAPPPEPEPEPVAMPAPPQFAMPPYASPEPVLAARSRGAAMGPLIGWVLSLVLLAGLASAAVTFRGGVMAAWPPSQRLFHGLGLR